MPTDLTNQADNPGCSWKAAKQVFTCVCARLPCSRPVRPTLCLRDMDSHFSRCQVPGGIPHEMPTQNPENLTEAIRSQLRNICAHWSTCHQRRHPTSSHRRLWPHRQTAGQHPQHIKPTVWRQPLTRSSSPSLLELSAWSSTWQMDRQNPKRHQPDTCRPLETGPWTRSSWTSDATAHVGYAMMMMCVCVNKNTAVIVLCITENITMNIVDNEKHKQHQE